MKPQPPVAAYLVESFTINWTFVASPATYDWSRPKTLLFSSDGVYFQAKRAIIAPSGNGSLPSRYALIAISFPNTARRSLRLPSSCATEISRQSRYPAGSLTSILAAGAPSARLVPPIPPAHPITPTSVYPIRLMGISSIKQLDSCSTARSQQIAASENTERG